MEPEPADPGLDALRRAYDADAARRSTVEPQAWRVGVVDDLVARLNAGARVLELGCGAGQLARHLLDHGVEVVGVDLSPAMVAAARERGVDARVGDLRSLPFPDGSFAGALAFNSLVHTPRLALPPVFTEVRRVLRVGAPFVVVVWGAATTHEGPLRGDWLDPPRVFSFLSDDDLFGLPTPGFERIEVRLLHEHADHGLHPQVLTLTAV